MLILFLIGLTINIPGEIRTIDIDAYGDVEVSFIEKGVITLENGTVGKRGDTLVIFSARLFSLKTLKLSLPLGSPSTIYTLTGSVKLWFGSTAKPFLDTISIERVIPESLPFIRVKARKDIEVRGEEGFFPCVRLSLNTFGDANIYFTPEGRVEIRGTTGDITISGSKERALRETSYNLFTFTGDIYIRNLIAEEVEARTTSGDIHLEIEEVPEEAKGFKYRLSSMSGEIESKAPEGIEVEKEKYHLKKLPKIPEIPELPEIPKLPEIPEIPEGLKKKPKKISVGFVLTSKPSLLPHLFYPWDYNRVEGWVLGLSLPAGDKDGWLHTGFGYGFTSKRWRLWLKLGKMFFQNRIGIGGKVFSTTMTEDRWKIGDMENGLFSLLFRQDRRDYYREKGIRFSLYFNPVQFLSITPSFETGEISGFEKKARFAILPLHDSFPDNPRIEEGNISLLDIGFWLGSKGISLEGKFQDSKDFGESHWKFYRLFLLSKFSKELYRSRLFARFVLGYSPDSLERPFRFTIGGIGTLPGYEYSEFEGNSMALLNLDYIINFGKFDGILFFDTGSSPWDGFSSLKSDAGIGIGIWGVSFRAVKSLEKEEKKMKLFLRFKQRF